MIFILPETKGISLERMDKIFGEVDAVTAGEAAGGIKGERPIHLEDKGPVDTTTAAAAADNDRDKV